MACPKTDNEKPEGAASAEALAAYVEVARTQYEQEEERWRSAQDKAKTIFAVAALVAALLLSRGEWPVHDGPGTWVYWARVSAVYVGAALLLAALVVAASVFTPKGAWGIEPADRALRKVTRIPPWQVPQYVGENYSETAKRNAKIIDVQLRKVRLATHLIIAAVALAITQILLALPAARAPEARSTDHVAVEAMSEDRAGAGEARGQARPEEGPSRRTPSRGSPEAAED